MQHLKKLTGIISVTVVLTVVFGLFTSASNPSAKVKVASNPNTVPAIDNTSVYNKLHLQELGLGENAYKLALKGWEKLKATGQVTKNIISICDFTQSSGNK